MENIKAVIMAAGQGTRMQPLSFDKQKHILKILNKSILEHTIDQVDGLVGEGVIVISKSRSCGAVSPMPQSDFPWQKLIR